MKEKVEPHYFHAEAHALAGQLVLPFKEEIKKQAFVKLEGQWDGLSDEERAQRNYFSQHAKNFRLEGIISYSAAHTQVSGHVSKKHEKASVTLATSEVVDLNVLNVVTADRVVAQVSTTHFLGIEAPSVTFLGTHFENLRIARHRVEPYLNLNLVGERPAGKDALYVYDGTGLMKAAESQYKNLKARLETLAEDVRAKIGLTNPESALSKKYHGLDLNYAEIKARADDANGKPGGRWDGITCSLVENVEIEDINVKSSDGKPPIPPPATSFGHVIHIPDFGTIYLGELRVNHNSFNLTMIRLELGCIADGNIGMSTANVNGGGKPPGP
jgi:hypothetical protein